MFSYVYFDEIQTKTVNNFWNIFRLLDDVVFKVNPAMLPGLSMAYILDLKKPLTD